MEEFCVIMMVLNNVRMTHFINNRQVFNISIHFIEIHTVAYHETSKSK